MMRIRFGETSPRVQAAQVVPAPRAPIFRFKPQCETFLEETFRAVAQLPD